MENLQRILEEIKSSDVVENRVRLLTQLEQLDLAEISELPSLVGCLELWEDFTCLDVSQCLLNKSILHVASKYLDLDPPDCLLHFLALGTKASQWCTKHLKMCLMSMEESQEEEHANVFFELLLDYFRFSASSFAAITKHSEMNNEALAIAVHKFVADQLKLTKEVTSNAKKVDSFSSEILKAAQVLIDSAVQLCKEYFQAMNQARNKTRIKGDEEKTRTEEARILNNFSSMAALAIKTLSELGVLAAKDGGSLVTILNASWKGVITLLQIDEQALVSKVDIAEIILKLLSLVKESLKYAAESWSCSLEETITVTEARRAFLPVKFYLINAVKIVWLFPSLAYVVHKEIALCILTVSTFKFSLSQQNHGKSASETMTDLLEKTSTDLLCTLLNSDEVKHEVKHALLDWAFAYEENFTAETCKEQNHSGTTLLADIFSVNAESAMSARILVLGRVALFQTVMRYSSELEEEAKLAITTKLQWFLDMLVDEEVYSLVLSSQIPMVDGSGKAIVWEPMFSALLLSLKTLMISVSSSLAWVEVETFLLQNFLHPHFLCWQIVMELWRFWVRHAKEESMNDMVQKLCSFMISLSSSEAAILPDSTLRRTARSVCLLLNNRTKPLVESVYKSVLSDCRSQLAADVYLALLLEGFPLNLLSDGLNDSAKQQIITDYLNFIESFNGTPSNDSRYSVFGAPVFALSACLQILSQTSVSEIDTKTLKFLTTLIHNCRNPEDKAMREHYHNILGETLAIISNIDELYTCQEMDNVILELEKLFFSTDQPDHLYKCKPSLTLFMAGLSHTEMSENETCSKSRAVWDLFHMLLKERHWALSHLAITAFGYFCARTSCNQLWRFVPNDAALAYDLASGNIPNTELFMSELKTFLEKQEALVTVTPSDEQLGLLVKEGAVIREMIRKVVEENERTEKRSNKKRKLPEKICRGVELLKNGVKTISDGLSHLRSNEMDSEELHDKFSSHFSCLEDLVSHLASLAGSD